MAKTNWTMNDDVMPEDMNQIGQEINDGAANHSNHRTAAVLDHPDGSVTTDKLADGAVTAAKVAPDVATQAELDAHANATNGAHGATSAATPNRAIQRDPAGRAKVAAPAAADDIARKDTVDAVEAKVGTLSSLLTTAKGNVVAAINELFTLASNGKALIAAAITGMGVAAASSDSFSQLATKIANISKDATAAASQILAGQSAYIGGVKVTGTMPNRGAHNITPGASAVTIPNGYHNGSGKVAAVAGLSAGNIRKGATVGGVAGTFSETANGATAAQVLLNREVAVNGVMVTGTMPNRTGHVTGQSVSRSGTTIRIRPQAGYYPGDSGNSVQIADANFIAANILSGKSIFGLAGTAQPLRYASGTATSSAAGTFTTFVLANGTTSNTWFLQIQGLGFRPKVVVATYKTTGMNPGELATIYMEGASFSLAGASPIMTIRADYQGTGTNYGNIIVYRLGTGASFGDNGGTLPAPYYGSTFEWQAWG